MSCHIRSFVACVTVLVLAASLAGPVLAQDQPLREDRPAVAGPERLLSAVWAWIAGEIAPGDTWGSLWGAEGWGMDPNGGGRTSPPPDDHP